MTIVYHFQTNTIHRDKDHPGMVMHVVTMAPGDRLTLGGRFLFVENTSINHSMEGRYTCCVFHNVKFRMGCVGARFYGCRFLNCDFYEGDILLDAKFDGCEFINSECRKLPIKKDPLCISGMRWPVVITDSIIRIGCQTHTHEEWERFTSEEISDMDNEAVEFWDKHKLSILNLARNHKTAFEGKVA